MHCSCVTFLAHELVLCAILACTIWRLALGIRVRVDRSHVDFASAALPICRGVMNSHRFALLSFSHLHLFASLHSLWYLTTCTASCPYGGLRAISRGVENFIAFISDSEALSATEFGARSFGLLLGSRGHIGSMQHIHLWARLRHPSGIGVRICHCLRCRCRCSSHWRVRSPLPFG